MHLITNYHKYEDSLLKKWNMSVSDRKGIISKILWNSFVNDLKSLLLPIELTFQKL